MNADFAQLPHTMPKELRIRLAEKMTQGYRNRQLSESDRKVALQLFHLLAEDVELRIRQILAEELKQAPDLPRDIALKLAQDVDSTVASPMLRHSQALTDDDLERIIHATENAACLLAIAGRETVSARVGETLVGKGHLEVAAELARNHGADISESVALKAAEVFGDQPSLLHALIERSALPADVAEKMVVLVSDSVRQELTKKYAIQPKTAERAVEATRERMVADMLRPGQMNWLETTQFVNHLFHSGRLTHSLLMQAICLGNMPFVESALAHMADISVDNVRKLMQDKGPLGFRALYKAANLPSSLYDAISTVLRLALEETHGGEIPPPDYRERMMRRIMSAGYHEQIDNMPFLLTILSHKPDALSSQAH